MRINCESPCPSFIKKAFVATIATVAIAAAIEAILRPGLNALVSMGNGEIAPLSAQDDFIKAIYSKREDEIALFLEKGTDLNLPNTDGTTPLAAAILTKNLPLTQQLLSLKADPNKEFCTFPPNRCTTPLIAAYVNDKEITWTKDEEFIYEKTLSNLFIKGANPRAKDSSGFSLLDVMGQDRLILKQRLEELKTTA